MFQLLTRYFPPGLTMPTWPMVQQEESGACTHARVRTQSRAQSSTPQSKRAGT